ncbi:hypothetical protein EAG_12258, partial [Camponotus floridanus]
FYQLGENFSLPTNNKTKLTTEFIKNFENNLSKLPPEKRVCIRNRSKNIINSISNYHYPKNIINRILTQLNIQTNQFIKDNKNHILTRADKVNITVS